MAHLACTYGRPGFDEFGEGRREPADLGLRSPDFHVDPCLAEQLDSFSGHLRKRVRHRRHDFSQSGGDDRIDARRRLSEMATRFERDEQVAPLRGGPGLGDGRDFGMRTAEALVPAFSRQVAGGRQR